MSTRFSHIVILLTGLFLAASQLAAAPLSWQEGPNLPVARDHAAAVISADGVVTVTGGAASAFPLYSLSLATASISPGTAWGYGSTSLDTLHVAPGAGIFSSGQILIFGGHEGDQASLDISGSFYPYSGNYYDLSRMTAARSYHGYASDTNGNVYAFGGLDANGNALASAERFANSTSVPPASLWTAIAPMPDTVFGFPAVFDGNDSIYVFGGGNVNGANSVSYNTYRYSVTTNSWTTMAPMLIATRESAAARGLNGKIYVMGGLSSNGAIADIQVYDVATNTWSLDGALLPKPLYGAAAVLDGQTRLMLIGGMDSNNSAVASVWTSQRLDQPDAAPAITSTPVTVGSVGTAYSYTVQATGSPLPKFTLTLAPAGMTIGNSSGVIAWTPAVGQDGAQAVTVQASNAAGTVTQSYTINVSATAPDTTAPSVPTGLVASNITNTSFRLDWTPSTDNFGVAGYRVYLVTRCGFKNSKTCYTLQQTVTGTSATISGLAAGTVYQYAVRAVDAAGNASALTAAISVTTLLPPSISHAAQCYTGEKVAAIVDTNLMVVCPGSATGINYYVQTTGNPKPVLSIVAGPAGMLADSGTGAILWQPVVGAPGAYTATVRATNDGGSADLIFGYTIYAAGTDLFSPSYPGTITVSNITQTSLTVSWTGATDNVGVTKYSVSAYSSCRGCKTSSANATTDGAARSVTLIGLLPDRQFTISVNASDAAGNVGPSGTLTGVRTLR
jgi:chitodextrinase